MNFWISVLEAGIRLSVPLLLLALGELVAERSGVINIGLEGKMSAGAYVGFLVMAASGDPYSACLAAIAAGMFVSAIMAGVSLWLGVNQLLTGFALFVMVPAITAFLHQQNLTSLIVTPALPLLSIEAFDHLPAIVRIFFSQNEFYYLTIVLCFAVWVLFAKTDFGLSLAACGHDPEVASSKGLSVKWLRTIATLICGAFAGLAGAALTVGALGQFNPGVTGGRGFIAIAAVILGRWRLGGVILAALAIGFTDALRLRLSNQVHFPVDLLAMLPWIVVLLMLIAGSRVANMPRALGRNIGSTATT
jgi:general nucleoside transport system permease protein